MNSQYYHHYNYCTLYIYIFLIDHFAHSQQPRSILYWAELLRCSQGSSTPRVCAWFAGCPATSEPAMEIHGFPRHLWTMIHWLIFHIFVLPLGAGCVGAMSAMSFLRGSWQSRHGDLRKKFACPGRQLESNRWFFLQFALQQTKGLGSTVDLDHLFIIYEILYAVYMDYQSARGCTSWVLHVVLGSDGVT